MDSLSRMWGVLGANPRGGRLMHTTPGHVSWLAAREREQRLQQIVDDADSNDLARDLAEANADCRCLTYWLMASWAVTFGAIGWAAWVTKLHFFP